MAAYACFSVYSFIGDLMYGSDYHQMHLIPKKSLIHMPIENFLARKSIAQKWKQEAPGRGEGYMPSETHNLDRGMNQTRNFGDRNTSQEEFGDASPQTTVDTALRKQLSSSYMYEKSPTNSPPQSPPPEFWDGPRWKRVLDAPVHQCAGNVRDIAVIDTGRSMIESVQNRRTALSIPPAELMRSWGLPDLADEYETAYRGGWYRRAAEWIQKMPLDDLQATGKHGKPMYAGLPALASEGRFREAAMSISFHLNGSKVNEPWPGVLVLRNALFTEGTQAMHE